MMKFFFTLGFILLLLLIKYTKGQADQIIYEKLTNFVFLSCNNQKKKPNNKLLDSIEKLNPQLMLWIGDYFYTDCTELRCLDAAYDFIKKDPFYVKLKNTFRIDGIYDDHDYNINNGDKSYKYKKEAKLKYLEYLEIPKDDIRYKREGAYISKLYIDPENENNKAKIIILDTRYNKDPYPFYAPDSKSGLVFFTIISVFTRIHCSIFGFYCNSKSDMLGEEQWEWLEKQLTDSDAKAHIIISSIQVFSNCVLNENWGLMPYALRRLRTLIKKTKPRGLLFLSGDIHISTLIGEEENVVEVTSSNVNQENILSYLNKYALFVASGLLNPFNVFDLNKMYSYANFGRVVINYLGDEETNIKTVIHDSDGNEVLKVDQMFNKQNNVYEKRDKFHIIYDDYASFTCKGRIKVCIYIFVYLLFVVWFLQIIYILHKITVSSKKTASEEKQKIQ